MTRAGDPTDDDAAASSPTRTVDDGTRLWIASARDDADTNTFLERFGLALSIAAHWDREDAPATPLALDILISGEAKESERDDALMRLGIAPQRQIRFVVARGEDSLVASFIECLAEIGSILAKTRHGILRVVLVDGNLDAHAIAGVPVGVQAAYSGSFAASASAEAFENAHDAFRLSVPSQRERGPYPQISGVWRDGSTLHSVAALCRISPDDMGRVPDVRVLERLREHHGDRILEVLEAFATTESVRKAGSELFMHRNTVTYWVQKAEAELGYPLSQPYGRVALFIALALHHLWFRAER